MNDPALAAAFALMAAVGSATFSIIVRKGQRYGNATTGVLIGLIVSVPILSAAILRKLGLGILQSPLLGVTFTSIAGLVFILGFSVVMPPGHRPDLRWGKAWFFYGLCGLIYTATFLLSFHANMRGDITIVTPISSMAPFFALVMSYLFLRDVERVTGLVVAGTALSVAGGVIIGWRVL